MPVDEDQLPVLLPDMKDWMPTGTGVSPLAAVDSFVNTTWVIWNSRNHSSISAPMVQSPKEGPRFPSQRATHLCKNVSSQGRDELLLYSSIGLRS